MRSAVALAACFAWFGCASTALPRLAPDADRSRAPDEAFRGERPARVDTPNLSERELRTHTLENGLDVILLQRTDLPIVSVAFVSREATLLQRDRNPGLPSVLAQALVHGTNFHGAPTDGLSVSGTEPTIDVSNEGLRVQLDVVSPGLVPALDLISQMVRNPILDERAVNLAKRGLIEELLGRASSRGAIEEQMLRKASFGESHKWSVSSREMLDALRELPPQSVAAFHAQTVRPESSALIVVGDFDEARALDSIAKTLGDWRSATAPRPTWTAPEPEGPSGRVLVLMTGGKRAWVTLIQPAVGHDDPDFGAFRVICALLSDVTGKSMKALRHERGATFDIACELDTYPGGGFLRLTSALARDDLKSSVALLRESLVDLMKQPVTTDALQSALTWAFGDEVPNTNEAAAAKLASGWAQTGSALALKNLDERLRTVTAADVQRVAKQYFFPERANLVLSGDLQREHHMLRTFGGEVEYFFIGRQ